ncbi:MAG TPA: metallophosphoesterase [Phenylobacterium sp.]|uniref:metallophosphoesterase family protein n=1 Tax=Phenylobacterium sp. TaxID=1871053 RepID=UPI002B971158|nr:metallophosphoesterase [Phenylobacterium sp.]HSV01937.1 metallophosphoesterase [Phenylobacterium sp.]
MAEAHRRRFLECLAWAGTGLVWTVSGGLPAAALLGAAESLAAPRRPAVQPFTFVQVSDSHIGFNKDPNPDARATLREAVAKIAALPQKPAFILHTGDVSQLSKASEFDDADQILKEAGLPVFHVPGEHDMLDEGQGQAFLERYGQGTLGDGWRSFDRNGVHFVGLVNVKDLQAGGMGHLGEPQLAWLAKDLAPLSASTPVVVYTHIPLWTIYREWGWGTDDAARALGLLKRFGSVTVLNGHIHQIIQKTEGNITFQTARSTAFPQPAPGQGPAPGPLKVPAGRLREALGVRTLSVAPGAHPLSLADAALA